MKLFLLLLRANASRVVLAVLVSVVSGVSSAGLVALVHHVWEQQEFTSTTWMLVFAGLLVLLIASGLTAQIMVLQLALKALVDLRMELSAKILSTPLRRVEELGAPRLLAVLTEDVTTLARVMPHIPRFVIDLTTLVAGAAYMAWLSWTALLVIIGFGLVGAIIYRLVMRRAMPYLRGGRDSYDVLFEHFRALHDGIKQLKLNRQRREHFLTQDLSGALEDFRGKNLAGRILLVISENSTRLLFFALLGILIFAVPRMEGLRVEVLTGYILMALYLYRPLGSLMALVPDFGKATVSLQKVDELGLSLDAAPAEDGQQAPAPAGWKTIELRGATFTFRREQDDGVFTMGPVDLTFRPGEVVFVMGGNGSGKTTLAKVLTSLYPLESGEIRLDGKPVTEADRARYRELFSVVFSDFHLFRNLLAREGGDLDARARGYLEELQLDRKVTVADGMLSTLALSQGQRKRLALLAAYLEDRPLYVFDEWASDQDPQFKRVFYTHVLPELRQRGKTAVVITHDDRYVHVADRCLKLEDGKVLEEVVLGATGSES